MIKKKLVMNIFFKHLAEVTNTTISFSTEQFNFLCNLKGRK